MTTGTRLMIPVGEPVRVFRPGYCWYHGTPGRVVGHTDDGQHMVTADAIPGRVMYYRGGGVEGIEPMRPRRPVACGFPCADAGEGGR